MRSIFKSWLDNINHDMLVGFSLGVNVFVALFLIHQRNIFGLLYLVLYSLYLVFLRSSLKTTDRAIKGWEDSLRIHRRLTDTYEKLLKDYLDLINRKPGRPKGSRNKKK